MRIVSWTAVSFLSGSIMYSYLLGKLLGVDIRSVGDHNPGAGNLAVAGRFWAGFIGALLDFAKALVPVVLASRTLGTNTWAIVPVAIAPILGHAYSPWLKFHGGKSLACTFGVWSALTGVVGVVPLGVGVAATHWLVRLDNDGWEVLCGLGLLLVALVIAEPAPLLALWTLNMIVFADRYRHELAHRPHVHLMLARTRR